MTTTKHTHAEQIENIVAHLEYDHAETRWMTEAGYNGSLRAIEYAKSPLLKAVPDLLEFIEWLATNEFNDIPPHVIKQARALSVKARGEA